ncbi:hypothetical protein EW146_g17 [Bondarzewia mesenterica]|uniref:Uncharacterized protein n=1 Tax=Bondarzewia mesenterica TaxID=1095465 RepID=A0A4S4M8J0_9AGAM|nr:hypothetical protein EW146_g17 [Bondarzewia mesenterica]
MRLAPRRLFTRAKSNTHSTSQPAPTSSTPAPVSAQAPNYPTTWSTDQNPRPMGTTGPRFEQTIMELQPQPLSAMEMIANEPVRLVHGRKAVCDGGASLVLPYPSPFPSPFQALIRFL